MMDNETILYQGGGSLPLTSQYEATFMACECQVNGRAQTQYALLQRASAAMVRRYVSGEEQPPPTTPSPLGDSE